MIDYLGDKIRLNFNGDCLKQPKLTYTHGKTVNIYIVYELGASSSFNDDPILKNSLFSAVKLKMLILISIDIQVMVLDLTEKEVFYFQVLDLVKM